MANRVKPWWPRRIREHHFVLVGFLGFLVFVAGAVVLLLGLLGSQLYSSVDCEWRPESARCTLLDERAGW